MHLRYCISTIVLGALVALAGCSKPAADAQVPAMEIRGIKVDMPKMQQLFATAAPELQSSASKASMSIRYGQFPEASAELAKLAAMPGLSDAQKKVVSDVTEQVKQLMAPAPSKAAQ
jgi:hypothetical protein